MIAALLTAVPTVALPTAAALLGAATPSPMPTPAIQVDPDLGSPGILGFVFTFVLALVLIALVLSMSRHLRKVDRNARLSAAADDEPAPSSGTSAHMAAPATTSADVSEGETGGDVGGSAGRGGDDEAEGRA